MNEIVIDFLSLFLSTFPKFKALFRKGILCTFYSMVVASDKYINIYKKSIEIKFAKLKTGDLAWYPHHLLFPLK